jgi:hypothetical protein
MINKGIRRYYIHRLHINRIFLEIRKKMRVMMTKLLSRKRHHSYQAETVASKAVAPVRSQKADGIQKGR